MNDSILFFDIKILLAAQQRICYMMINIFLNYNKINPTFILQVNLINNLIRFKLENSFLFI